MPADRRDVSFNLRHVAGGDGGGLGEDPAGRLREWTGTAYQEVAASGQTGAILGLAVLFAFLFLVGLYENWMIPAPVLLSVPVGVLGGVSRNF
jgi:multidrug efflux pump subunit AcrB